MLNTRACQLKSSAADTMINNPVQCKTLSFRNASIIQSKQTTMDYSWKCLGFSALVVDNNISIVKSVFVLKMKENVLTKQS